MHLHLIHSSPILIVVIRMYRCPKCKKELVLVSKSYKCSNNHSFDVAKEGYVNLLLTNSKNHGDNKDMVLARRHFLEHDYYKPMAEEVISLIEGLPHASVIDLGCGEGYYTNMMKEALESDVYANDLSKEAIRLASKTNKAIHYFIASSADLPLPDASLDLATCIFSYIDFKENHRILKDGGYLITVMPAKRHLFELKQAIYDTPYENPENIPLDDHFELVETKEVTYPFTLDSNEAIKELFTMTPYYFKTSLKDKEKLDNLNHLVLHASFLINIYKKH